MALLLIDSEWVDAPRHCSVLDPFTGGEIGSVPVADRSLLQRALAAAQRAYSKTRRQPPYERSVILQRVVVGVEKRRAEFVDLIVREAGKPISLAEIEVERALMTFQIAAEEARHPGGELLDLDALPPGENHFGLVRRVPIGVVTGITPFNFPLNLVAHKVAPCLASGNCMVLKPALKTPLAALKLGEVLVEAGMTAGQINVVTCSNEDAQELLEDPRVKMISFTGSPAVGWKIKAGAGQRRVALELGGNAGVIVHEDADLAAAVPMICGGAFAYAGQSCISVQRIFVQDSIYPEFRERMLTQVAEHIHTGDPRDRKTLVGPMIEAEACARAERWIEAAVRAGATRLCGRKVSEVTIQPTLLENVDSEQEINACEAFAPVAILKAYHTYDEALAMLNASDFGLQAGVFTRDISRAHQAFSEIEAGAVLINQVPTFRVEQMPYGGVKDSGFGREGIRFAMDEMTELKTLIVRL